MQLVSPDPSIPSIGGEIVDDKQGHVNDGAKQDDLEKKDIAEKGKTSIAPDQNLPASATDLASPLSDRRYIRCSNYCTTHKTLTG